MFGVSQRFILRTLLFKTNFASYSYDNTRFVAAENFDDVVKLLKKDSIKLFQWFPGNQMKANHDKFYLLVSDKNLVIMKVSGFEAKIREIKVYYALKSENYSDSVI